eukprot:3280590-Amphidinium_carterae.1
MSAVPLVMLPPQCLKGHAQPHVHPFAHVPTPLSSPQHWAAAGSPMHTPSPTPRHVNRQRGRSWTTLALPSGMTVQPQGASFMVPSPSYRADSPMSALAGALHSAARGISVGVVAPGAGTVFNRQ